MTSNGVAGRKSPAGEGRPQAYTIFMLHPRCGNQQTLN